VQKLLANPPILQDFLNGEIAALDRLVDRAMKKKPKPARMEAAERACAGA
jgi:hypothetical protein